MELNPSKITYHVLRSLKVKGMFLQLASQAFSITLTHDNGAPIPINYIWLKVHSHLMLTSVLSDNLGGILGGTQC
jgi:hypothetical protein